MLLVHRAPIQCNALHCFSKLTGSFLELSQCSGKTPLLLKVTFYKSKIPNAEAGLGRAFHKAGATTKKALHLKVIHGTSAGRRTRGKVSDVEHKSRHRMLVEKHIGLTDILSKFHVRCLFSKIEALA